MATSFDSQLDFEKTSKLHSTNNANHKPAQKKPFCDFCRKVGHVEENCFKKQVINRPNSTQPKPVSRPNTQNNQAAGKYNKFQQKDTGIKSRPATVNWSQTNNMVNSITGTVNGYKADITLDTGAQITVVPGKFIYDDNLTGETIDILGVNGNPRSYQIARIPITINNIEVEEEVAVAPENQLNSRVLLATPMCKVATQHLIDSYLDKNGKAKKVQVVTRSKTATKPPISYTQQLETTYNEDDKASDLSYNTESEYTDTDETAEVEEQGQTYAPRSKCPKSSHLSSSPHHPKIQTRLSPEPYSSTPTPEPHSSTPSPEPYSSTPTPEPHSSTLSPEPHSSTPPPEPYSSNSNLEPYSSNPNSEPYSSNPNSEPYSSNPNSEPYSSTLTPEPYSPEIQPEIQPEITELTESQRNTHSEISASLPDLPITSKGNITNGLKTQTKDDQSLKTIRGLAHHSKNGYAWENGLIFHTTTDHTLGEQKRLVVPKLHRQNLIRLAHNKSGPFSVNKTKAILNHKFTWPGISTDVREYILSCDKCKAYNKHTHKPAPLHTKPVITEPFDEIALDIIGPLPRSRHGYRFALTAICMASRWPEVYPLKDTKAENITNALVEFLARNGIPSKILTDQGSQFTSEVMAQTCQMLGITHITTIPYRPQGNGILERFHGTLKPLLAKVTSTKLDWVQLLPMALSAIRAVPCRSTGFSPSEIVFGRNSRNVLDIVYVGWTNIAYSTVDISAWVDQLNDRLEILRDAATLTNTIARQKQNAHGKHSRSSRTYKPGDLVFTRIPGCRANLQASWEGPFEVKKSIPPLNYEIQDAQHTWSRITHINNLKSFKPLPTPKQLHVRAVCLVAEETQGLSEVLDSGPSLVGGVLPGRDGPAFT